MPEIILKINTCSDEVYEDDKICCYLLETSLGETYLSRFDRKDKLVLLIGAGAEDLCRRLNFDGVVTEPDLQQPLKSQIKKSRELIGNKKVLGVIICPRRHEAMLAGEAEPEFIAFKFKAEEKAKAKAVIRWYNELFLIQSALIYDSSLQDIASYPMDFLIINSQDYKNFGC